MTPAPPRDRAARRCTPRATAALVAVMALSAGLAMATGLASAASPVKGGRYVIDPHEGWEGLRGQVRVSNDGRRIRPAPWSSVRLPRRCGESGFVTLPLGTRRRPVRIAPNGRFRWRWRPLGYFTGRFTSRRTVKLDGLRCDGRALVLGLYRPPPFRDCRSYPARSALETPAGRVFVELRYGRVGWEHVLSACLFSDDGRVGLGRRRYETDDAGFQYPRLAGTYAAFSEFYCGVFCYDTVHVVDLRTGEPAREPVWFANRLRDFELSDSGSFAVILFPSMPTPTPQAEVWAYEALGSRLLDSGNIAPWSLELAGSTLTWLNDGAQRSAALD